MLNILLELYVRQSPGFYLFSLSAAVVLLQLVSYI